MYIQALPTSPTGSCRCADTCCSLCNLQQRLCTGVARACAGAL